MLYVFGDCILDAQLYTVQRIGQSIRLRPKVFQLLHYLLEHRDRVVPKKELCEHIWPDYFISEATLESTLRAVREVVGDSGRAQRLIQTLYGHGYRFVAAVEKRQDREPGTATRPGALAASTGDAAAAPGGELEVEARRPAPEAVRRLLPVGRERRWVAVPATIEAVLAARLDRLPPEAKHMVQVAAVIGPEMPAPLLQSVLGWQGAAFEESLAHLRATEFLYEAFLVPEPVYTFKHVLIQEAAYQGLLPRTRQMVHAQIAQVVEARFPETAETQPELLAHHYSEAAQHEDAIPYWLRAGQRAAEHGAHGEAIGHLTRGLEVLTKLPDTPEWAQQELEFQIALGRSLMIAKGYGTIEAGHAYSRALVLCQQMREPSRLFSTLRGLWQFYHSQGALQTALELGEQLHRLARHQHNSAWPLVAHTALGTTLFFLGEFALARTHFEQGIALDDPEGQRALAVHYGIAPGIQCRALAAQVLWRLGYPDQALRQSHKACTEAQELAHPPSLAFTLYYVTRLHIHRREVQATDAQAEHLMTLSTERGFAQRVAAAMFFRGWALAMQGYGDKALAQMSQGLTAVLATGQATIRPIFLTLLSEVYGKVGRGDEALSMLAEARATMDESGRSDLKAEMDRLQGEILLHQATPDVAHAEACFQTALDIAGRQGAKSLELRAAMSLSRLWQHQSNRTEARTLLAEVYNWFTEGFDTVDMQEAKALLAELT